MKQAVFNCTDAAYYLGLREGTVVRATRHHDPLSAHWAQDSLYQVGRDRTHSRTVSSHPPRCHRACGFHRTRRPPERHF